MQSDAGILRVSGVSAYGFGSIRGCRRRLSTESTHTHSSCVGLFQLLSHGDRNHRNMIKAEAAASDWKNGVAVTIKFGRLGV